MTDSQRQDSWADGLSGADRVEAVALTVSEPRTANWIADEADVAHATAKKYLSRLAADGALREETQDGHTTYQPDPVSQYLRETRELYESHTPDELAASLGEMNDQIRTWKREYDVETPNDLRASIGDAASERDERERRETASEWEHLAYRRRLVEDALHLHDRFPGEPTSTPA